MKGNLVVLTRLRDRSEVMLAQAKLDSMGIRYSAAGLEQQNMLGSLASISEVTFYVQDADLPQARAALAEASDSEGIDDLEEQALSSPFLDIPNVKGKSRTLGVLVGLCVFVGVVVLLDMVVGLFEDQRLVVVIIAAAILLGFYLFPSSREPSG